jgi:hypothetical protein
VTIAVVVVICLVAVSAIAFLVIARRRPDDGVTSFRRHIDALSPEARREVIERVQNARESGKGK